MAINQILVSREYESLPTETASSFNHESIVFFFFNSGHRNFYCRGVQSTIDLFDEITTRCIVLDLSAVQHDYAPNDYFYLQYYMHRFDKNYNFV